MADGHLAYKVCGNCSNLKTVCKNSLMEVSLDFNCENFNLREGIFSDETVERFHKFNIVDKDPKCQSQDPKNEEKKQNEKNQKK
jgi:hypothetical protein